MFTTLARCPDLENVYPKLQEAFPEPKDPGHRNGPTPAAIKLSGETTRMHKKAKRNPFRDQLRLICLKQCNRLFMVTMENA